MRTSSFLITAISVFLALAVLCPVPANATLTMKVVPHSVQQFGTGSGVSLGHTVIAGTNLNRLIAGGTFVVTCGYPDMGTITGARTLPSNKLGQYNQLYVTVPETVPSLRNLPGFLNLPRGSEIMCDYNWTAFAEEPVYTIGVPGFTYTVGGEKYVDSGSVTFWMRKPGTATGGDDACIP